MIRKKLFLSLFVFILLWSSVLQADTENTEYRLKEMTPTIQKALNGQKSRSSDIQVLKEQGLIGEGNQGLIQMLKPSKEAAPLIEPENNDRAIIYDAIIQQNKLGPVASVQVAQAFVEARRTKAKPGEFFQDAFGKWVKK